MTLPTSPQKDIRERLLRRRDELRGRLDQVNADQRRAAGALSADAPDRAIQLENDEVIDSIGQTTRAELVKIDAALGRLDAGRYGICEDCERVIEAQRLAAVPYATQCLQCISEPNAS
jgi:RNA polymerase-binding transcription factor